MNRRRNLFLILSLTLVLSACLDLCLGNVTLSLRDIFSSLFGHQEQPVVREIVCRYRLPKMLTAILAGVSLSLSGLLMQTLFRNPLAGPDVLGVNSGASLGVALLTMLSSVFGGVALSLGSWSLVVAAVIGALLVLMLVLAVSRHTPDVVSLLIVGMMFGYLAGALVSVLQSLSNPEALKIFVVWTFGSLSAVSWQMMPVLSAMVILGCLMSFLLCKPMNGMMLGESYAASLGISVKRVRFWMILATALMTGGITAFAGPISFVGITVPHIARGLFKEWEHRTLIPAVMLCGASLLLLCDIVCSLPCFNASLPINAVTALVGAPVIVWIILKNRK